MSSVKIYNLQFHLQLKPRRLLFCPFPATHASVQYTQTKTSLAHVHTQHRHIILTQHGGTKKGYLTKWKLPLSLIENYANTSIHRTLMLCAMEQQPTTKEVLFLTRNVTGWALQSQGTLWSLIHHKMFQLNDCVCVNQILYIWIL